MRKERKDGENKINVKKERKRNDRSDVENGRNMQKGRR